MPTDDELIAAFIATKGVTRLPKSASSDIDWRHQIKRHHTDKGLVTHHGPHPDATPVRQIAAIDHADRAWFVNEHGEVVGHI